MSVAESAEFRLCMLCAYVVCAPGGRERGGGGGGSGREQAYPTTRIPGLHHETISTLHLHAVIELPIDKVKEVASCYRRIVAIKHHTQDAALQASFPCACKFHINVHSCSALHPSGQRL